MASGYTAALSVNNAVVTVRNMQTIRSSTGSGVRFYASSPTINLHILSANNIAGIGTIVDLENGNLVEIVGATISCVASSSTCVVQTSGTRHLRLSNTSLVGTSGTSLKIIGTSTFVECVGNDFSITNVISGTAISMSEGEIVVNSGYISGEIHIDSSVVNFNNTYLGSTDCVLDACVVQFANTDNVTDEIITENCVVRAYRCDGMTNWTADFCALYTADITMLGEQAIRTYADTGRNAWMLMCSDFEGRVGLDAVTKSALLVLASDITSQAPQLGIFISDSVVLAMCTSSQAWTQSLTTIIALGSYGYADDHPPVSSGLESACIIGGTYSGGDTKGNTLLCGTSFEGDFRCTDSAMIVGCGTVDGGDVSCTLASPSLFVSWGAECLVTASSVCCAVVGNWPGSTTKNKEGNSASGGFWSGGSGKLLLCEHDWFYPHDAMDVSNEAQIALTMEGTPDWLDFLWLSATGKVIVEALDGCDITYCTNPGKTLGEGRYSSPARTYIGPL